MNWFAIYTRFGSEERAAESLRQQEFETYLPMFKKKYIGQKRNYYESCPLFPTYIFARFSLDQNGWRNILTTIGVKGILPDSDEPFPLPDTAIDGLKSQEYAGFIRMPDWPLFHKGQRVRITSGSLLDTLATVDYMDRRARVMVLLSLFGRETPAQVLSRHLEPADNQMTVKRWNSP